jgi:type I restriction enzyme R subunit
MDSYRVEKKAVVKIQLPDSDTEIEPVHTSDSGLKPGPEIDRVSNIIKIFTASLAEFPGLIPIGLCH